MRRNFLILFTLILIGGSNSFASDFILKSLRVYSSLGQTEFPIIDLKDSTRNSITIEFDILSVSIPNLNIIFKFCDSQWIPYENVFLLNPGNNTEYNIWFERLPQRITGARYHYQGSFPNRNVSFPFSGKWKFFIVDSQNPKQIYGEGKFYVIYPEVKINVSINRERAQNFNAELANLNYTYSIQSSFILPDSLFPSNVKSVEVIENRKLNYPIIIDRRQFDRTRFYEWNGSNRFTFIARDLRPGNEYRQTDLRDYNRFNTKDVNAQLDGIETSNFFRKLRSDLNGASFITDFRNEYSEYLNVNFRIRPPENITQPVFLVGSFNNWQVLPQYEMFDDNGLLNLKIELKRGLYDYQYVVANYKNRSLENIDWNILEGNYWDTSNEYHIFLYYESNEKGGYDKIIGYRKIKSGELWRN
jgi:hypothetical protein